MSLTVSARIAGGFSLVVALLVITSITSISSIRSISNNLHSVVEDATPMLQNSGETISELLEANDKINRHQKSQLSAELGGFEKEFEQIKARFVKRQKLLAKSIKLIQGAESPFNDSRASSERYFALIPEVIANHQLELQLAEKISDAKGEFEDAADNVDSIIFDFADEVSDSAAKEQVQAIGNLIRESTISTLDALNLDRLTTIQTVYKDNQAIIEAVNSRYSALGNTSARSSDYYSELREAIDSLLNMTSGNESLLSLYMEQIRAGNLSAKTLNEAEGHLSIAISKMRTVVSSIKQFADRSKDEAISQVESSLSIIVIMLIAAVVAAGVISYLVIRGIRGPLSDIVEAIAQVATGDLTQRIDIQTNDELGGLAASVNDLAVKLRDIVGRIADSAQQLASSAEETEAIAKQGHESINRQREQTELVATAMTEMTATVGEVANSANNTLQEVQSANQETVRGQEVVESNIRTINKLAGEIEESSNVTNKLNEYSENIGSVLDVIRGIADQTNLLALNAAIEAARAGEQGRGFAVVADEVRTLASKTQVSTSEIQDMIERLQNGTRDAVNVMQQSQTEAQLSVDQTALAGEALQSITRAVAVINDMSTHIASSAEEQSSVTNEMHENISNISALAEQNAQGANESLSASRQLAVLAEQLQQMVMQFKI
ncbi:methyl-accepting chemotaxis protein [Pleionea sp. CnH1-48]|uniref:methyl-accepting chemotaxis protein n=1 Tax=Pleionea sp. CnH1-48 TaxID=2954494 RepID=UPI0020978840|nr:methyl-accepting chemotaxis protein [Pleionea sp. CnH1-48]MCO7226442.1 methyl-accepting chemotaxis protein [Pleionea sp. CnH1-48]